MSRTRKTIPTASVDEVVDLRKEGIPYVYAGNAADVDVAFFRGGMVEGVSTYTLAAIAGIGGLTRIEIATGDMPTAFTAGTLVVSSPTGQFDPQLLDLVVEVKTIDQAIAEITAAGTTASAVTDGKLDDALARIEEVLAVAEYNWQRNLTFDEATGKVTSMDLLFVKDDAAAGFSTPDRHLQLTFTYDANGRCSKTECWQVLG